MRARSAPEKMKILMTTMTKLGLTAFAAGAFTILPGKADTPDATIAFTKHGLPVPGAYFRARENQQAATIAVSKSGVGVGQAKQTSPKAEKAPTRHVRSASSNSQ